MDGILYVIPPSLIGLLFLLSLYKGLFNLGSALFPDTPGGSDDDLETPLQVYFDALMNRRLLLLAGLHSIALVLLFFSSLRFPDSLMYSASLGCLAWMHVVLLFCFRLEWLSVAATSRALAATHGIFIVFASALCGPQAEWALMWLHALPSASMLHALLGGLPVASGFLVFLLVSGIFLRFFHPSAPLMCVSCLEYESRYLPYCTAALILCQVFLLSQDNEAQKEKMRKKHTSIDELRSRFISSVAHEIRTPLNGIVGCVQLLQQNGGDFGDAQSSEYFLSITHCTQVLSLLLENVLAFGNPRAAPVQVPSMVLIQDFASHIEHVLRGLAFAHPSMKIEMRISPSVPNQGVVLCGSLMLQVILNLGSNAIKFQTGQPEALVEISVDYQEGVLSFEVRDQGPGVPPDFVSRLFKPYQRNGNMIQGTGLGLSISKQLVESMRGEIGHRPSPNGKGAIFFVRVPTTTSTHGAGPSPPVPLLPLAVQTLPARPPPTSSAGEPARLEVLIVEDVVLNQRILCSMLEKIQPGCRIHCVSEGVSCLEFLLRRHREAVVARTAPSQKLIVFMDITMPLLSGVDTCTLWRACEGMLCCPRTYLVAQSALDPKVLSSSGFDAVLPKPVQLPKLASTVAVALKKYS